MNKKVIFAAAVLMIAGAAGVLLHLKSHQTLGKPGVRTAAASDPNRLQVVLPELVLDYTSEPVEVEEMVLNFLPRDTSFGQRRYVNPDGFQAVMNVVLMGSDRTSLHKPQFCLTGSGWDIDQTASAVEKVRIDKPVPYDLPVMKLLTTKKVTINGQPMLARGVYVYWFVAEDAYTAHHWQRMWWMAKNMMRTGVLQRWAYVTCFCVCAPGQEDATYARMKEFIAASVPEFQLFPRVETARAEQRPAP